MLRKLSILSDASPQVCLTQSTSIQASLLARRHVYDVQLQEEVNAAPRCNATESPCRKCNAPEMAWAPFGPKEEDIRKEHEIKQGQRKEM